MLDFFSRFAIQIIAVLAIFGIIYVTSKLRKPKSGEVTVETLNEKFAIVRITLIAPMMLWFIPLIGVFFYLLITSDYDNLWLLILAFAIPGFYMAWIMGAVFPMMTKRNFITSRLQYMKNPKAFNAGVVDGPIVAKRLAIYPQSLRKAFIFLANSKWF
jgi:uncharacterized membrane protein YciS (DUF1049 family)